MSEKMRTLADKLWSAGACGGAGDWVRTQKSPQQAWDDCREPDWMYWLVINTARGHEDLQHNTLLAISLAKDFMVLLGAEEVELCIAEQRYILPTSVPGAAYSDFVFGTVVSSIVYDVMGGSSRFVDSLKKNKKKEICNRIRQFYPKPPLRGL